jgi:hypothetical protein
MQQLNVARWTWPGDQYNNGKCTDMREEGPNNKMTESNIDIYTGVGWGIG